MTKESWFDHMTFDEQEAHQAWMDEIDAEYLEEEFISERAHEEDERNFIHYQD